MATAIENSSDATKNAIQNLTFGRTVFVGAGSGIATIQDALDSILDAAADKEYTIQVLPGTYARFDTTGKDYITIRGSGNSTVIEVSAQITNQIFLKGYRIGFKDCRVVYTENGNALTAEGYAVGFGTFAELQIENIEVDIKLDNSARTATIYAFGGGASKGLGTINTNTYGGTIRGCTIVSDGSGFKLGSDSTLDFYDNNIFLTTRQGANAPDGIDHIGLNVISNGRLFWFSGRISSGYAFLNVDDAGGNTYGIYISSTGSNCRLNVHDIRGIIRNDNASPGAVAFLRVPSTVAANCECRLYGFNGAAEAPTGAPRIIHTDYSYNANGRVLLMSAIMGGKSTGNIAGDRYEMDAAWDAWESGRREIKTGGKWFCTAATAFGVLLPVCDGETGVKPLTIINEFASAANVTIGQGTGTPTFDVVGGTAGQTSVVITPGTSKEFRIKPNGHYWVS